MPFPIEQIEVAKSAYVSDSLGILSAIEFPLMRGLSRPEQDLIERKVKESTHDKAKELINPISMKVVEVSKTFKEPEDVGIILYNYLKKGQFSNTEDFEKVAGISALHSIQEFENFVEIIEKSRKINQCIRVWIMMNRTMPDKALGWNPKEWKVENALDPTEINTEHSTQISLLCQLEERGEAHYCIETRMNKAGEAVNVFYYSDSNYTKSQEKYENNESKGEPENVEETVKK